MGLNLIYSVVRKNILMMNPLQSISQVFSIFIKEEKQREVRPPNHSLMEFTSLNACVYNTGKKNFMTNYTQHTNPHNSNAGTSESNAYRAKQSSHKSHTERLSHICCDYCKKSGHIREKCYRLHRFPTNFKFINGRNTCSTTNVQGVGSETDENY